MAETNRSPKPVYDGKSRTAGPRDSFEFRFSAILHLRKERDEIHYHSSEQVRPLEHRGPLRKHDQKPLQIVGSIVLAFVVECS